MSKIKFTAIHPVKGVRRACYVENGYVYFAPGWRVWVPRKFFLSDVNGLRPAED